jgi:YVTN family beta-propeller protein
MRLWLACGVGIVVASLGMWAAQAQTPAATTASAPTTQGGGLTVGGFTELKVLKSFPAGGEGGWDCVTVDSAARRVYVARATRVMVFDADTGKLVGEVADTPGAHGVAISPEPNLGFVTNGKDGTVGVFDLKTLKVTQKIPAGKKPDIIMYEPASKKIWALNNDSGDITIIDPAALDKTPITLAIGGKLEFAATDEAGRVYVNVEDKNEVVAIDSKQMKVLAHWPLEPGTEPTGLAIDIKNHLLFAVCNNQKMIVLDAESGKVLASPAIGPRVDGAAFDAKRGVAMSANGGDGTVTVVKIGNTGQFTVAQTLKTVKGARTIAFDPKTGWAYLPCQLPGENGQTSFGLLVVGMP